MSENKITSIFTNNISTPFDGIVISTISNANYNARLRDCEILSNKTCIMNDIDPDLKLINVIYSRLKVYQTYLLDKLRLIH